MKIGMRNIKTTLSVFICLLLFGVINRENSVFACIAAVICMQNTVVDSMEKGIARIIGTIIGGVVGALVLFIVNTFFNDNLLIFIIPLGIMILIQICVVINMKQSVIICCVVYLSVMITKNHDGGYLLYTINRVLDTSIGILIALLVNKYVGIPEKLKLRFKQNENEIPGEDEDKDDEQNREQPSIF
jgi:uncharacterized membrane protein YgaE (UPF0421/DUF939 family)